MAAATGVSATTALVEAKLGSKDIGLEPSFASRMLDIHMSLDSSRSDKMGAQIEASKLRAARAESTG